MKEGGKEGTNAWLKIRSSSLGPQRHKVSWHLPIFHQDIITDVISRLKRVQYKLSGKKKNSILSFLGYKVLFFSLPN
jgi:hypothetical protein